MAELTKEWLLTTIAELEEERDATPGAVNEDALMALAAMKIALASLEAEAVAYVDPFAFHNFIVYRAGETYNKRMGREWMWANPDAGLIPVYTAPPATPAPVSVPDLLEQFAEFMAAESIKSGDYPDGWQSKASNAAHEYAQNISAAMLQSFGNSEQLNSPVIQDGWVACVERMPSAGEQVLAYRPDAPESNDPLIKMATYVGGSAHGHGFDCYCKPTHWMPLPAAPQQEVESQIRKGKTVAREDWELGARLTKHRFKP